MTTPILTAAIVDDERLARLELRSLLAEHPEIHVVGEADSIQAAVALIAETAPDVVFLDIQMPGESGFDLFERTKAAFQTVFVTAHNQHALRAFEVNALDYLLKPIHPDRLAETVHRLVEEGKENETEPSRPRKLEYDDRLFLGSAGRFSFLKIGTIRFISGAGEYSQVVTTDGKTVLTEKPLREWEERLPEKFFMRIHRQTVVNLDCVTHIEQGVGGTLLLFVSGQSEPLAVSRRGAAKLKERFG